MFRTRPTSNRTERTTTAAGRPAAARGLALALVVLSVGATAPAAAAQQHPAVPATVDGSAAAGDLEFEVTQDENFDATVTVTDDGSAAPNATVEVDTVDSGSSYDGAGEYVTDEDGTVELPAPDEDVEVRVRASYEGATAETTAVLEAPGGFAVRNVSTNSPVTEGEALTVTVTVENTGDVSGTRTVDLTVGGTRRDATEVVIDARDVFQNNTVRGEMVAFGSDASDPDGTIASYEWTVDGEVVSSEPVLEHTFEEPGSHEVRLRVTDDRGATATATRTIQVTAPEPTTARAVDGTPTGVETPGFGPAAGLAAAGAALLVLRRRH